MNDLVNAFRARVVQAETALNLAQSAGAKAAMREVLNERREALAIVLASEADATAFKRYVHERLDRAGVPADPDGPHKDAGCRIGGRLDIVLDAYTNTDPLERLMDAKPETAEAMRCERARIAKGFCDACNYPRREDGTCTREGCYNSD